MNNDLTKRQFINKFVPYVRISRCYCYIILSIAENCNKLSKCNIRNNLVINNYIIRRIKPEESSIKMKIDGIMCEIPINIHNTIRAYYFYNLFNECIRFFDFNKSSHLKKILKCNKVLSIKHIFQFF